ncbi:MAG: exo-alpha-sialidase [Ruminococcaceae bacterium]|nr:exo-alpha-sialidase [Oscillospiraceae bacterium]
MKIITPTVEHGIVSRSTTGFFGYHGWPTIARDENGTLYTVASGFRMEHVCPFGKTTMYISRNNGKTWTPPIVINDTFLDDRDAGILYMGNGRLLVTWFCHSATVNQTELIGSMKWRSTPREWNAMKGMLDGLDYITPEEGRGGSFIRISEDYGVTWSDTIRIGGSAPHGPNLMRDGSILYLGKDMYITTPKNIASEQKIRAYRSVDGGYTWEELGSVPIPENHKLEYYHEPHVVELPDGRLLGALRVQGSEDIEGKAYYRGEFLPGFTIYTTISDDGGRTWSMPKPTGANGSPPHLLLHSSGALICSHSRRDLPIGIHAMVSYDLGESWAEEYLIEDRMPEPDERLEHADLGYPSTVELDDGSLFTVYYAMLPGDEKTSVVSAHWSLGDAGAQRP